MFLPSEKTGLLQQFIKNIYTAELNDDFLAGQSDLICALMDSHYFATILFPNRHSGQTYYFSNNPGDFNDIYVPLQSKDVLLNTLMNHNSPVFYREVKNWDIPGKNEFFGELQRVRPVSDCCYIPLKLDDCICGFTAIARADLKNREFGENDLELFQFITAFLNEGFIRTLRFGAPRDNQAMIDGFGHITNAGDRMKDCFISLFGKHFWNDPRYGTSQNSLLFEKAYHRFISDPVTPNSGSVCLSYGEATVSLEFRWIDKPEYRSFYPSEPQVSVTLKESPSAMAAGGIQDWNRINLRFQFTPREMDIIDCIFRGFSNRDIADHLKITESTVKKHIWNIFNKAGVDSRTGLIFSLS